MRLILLLTFFLLEIAFSQTIIVSAHERFVPFLKKLEKSQEGLNFIIRDKNSSLDAFNELKSTIATVAIVRGDILADNMGSKNFFEKSAFTDFKVLSKLKEDLSSFLYLISKDGENNAYTLLNPDSKNKKMKRISIGYLKDLSNIYLADIAKSVNSNYRFRYKSFSPEQSLEKLKEGSIDAAYMFVSKEFAQKARKEGFILKNIIKPASVKLEDFAKKITEQKAFNRLGTGIRVDNYLVVSSSISDIELAVLISSLKSSIGLISNIKPEFGAVDTRVVAISTKIDIEKVKADAEAEEKAKECEESKVKIAEIIGREASLKVYKKDALKRIETVLLTVENSVDLTYFKPQLENLLLSVNESGREADKLIKGVKDEVSDCDVKKIDSSLIALDGKIGEIKDARKELAILQGEILKKGQLDQEQLLRELREQELREESENKALEAQLEAELEKKKKEAESGFFSTIKKAFE